MNTTKATRIIDSLRDQRLDVSIGILAPAEYVTLVQKAREIGVDIPADVADFAARCATVEG